MELVKSLFFKFFSKEKILAGAIGAALVAGAAGLGADSDAVKKLFCEQKQEQSK